MANQAQEIAKLYNESKHLIAKETLLRVHTWKKFDSKTSDRMLHVMYDDSKLVIENGSATVI